MTTCHFADVHSTVTYTQKDKIKESRGERTEEMTRMHAHNLLALRMFSLLPHRDCTCTDREIYSSCVHCSHD